MAENPSMGISAELDELSCELIGESLDVLAAGDALGVVASVLDGQGRRLTCAFDDDGIEVCLEAARDWVRRLASGSLREADFSIPRCYAICFLGSVDAGHGFSEALMEEFGEADGGPDYSAYLLVEGIGQGDGLRWSDPLPAGEVTPLLSDN